MSIRTIDCVGLFLLTLVTTPAGASTSGLNFGADFVPGKFTGSGRTDFVHFRGDHARVWINQGDGTFKHKVFSPWAGYAVGDSSAYIAADVTGDLRTDLVHCIGSSVNIWKSNGDGTFTVTNQTLPSNVPAISSASRLKALYIDNSNTVDLVQFDKEQTISWLSNGSGFSFVNFTPWPGYAVNYGLDFQVGAYSSKTIKGLLHFASDYVHIWANDGDGTFTISTFRPWPGYPVNGASRFKTLMSGQNTASDVIHFLDTSVNIWTNRLDNTFSIAGWSPASGYAVGTGSDFVSGNFGGDSKTDLLHIVTGGTKYVHPWIRNTAGTFDLSTYDAEGTLDISDPKHVKVGRANGDSLDDIFHFTDSKIDTWATTGANPFFNITSYSPTRDYEFTIGGHEVKETTSGTIILPDPNDGMYHLRRSVDYDFSVWICNHGYDDSGEIWMLWKEDGMIVDRGNIPGYGYYHTGVPQPGTCYRTATRLKHETSVSHVVTAEVNAPIPYTQTRALPEYNYSDNVYTFVRALWFY